MRNKEIVCTEHKEAIKTPFETFNIPKKIIGEYLISEEKQNSRNIKRYKTNQVSTSFLDGKTIAD
jgi:hypothetical protein